jgi:hypothetical protein
MTSPRERGMLARMPGRSLLLVFSSALLLACNGGTETGNPPFTGSLSYTGHSSRPDAIGVREGGSIATVKNAWFELRDVSFSAAQACGEAAFSVPALGIGDHAAGAHVSTPYSAEPGEFCGVELPFARVADSAPVMGFPAELRSRSILLEGALADGTPFSLTSEAEPVLSLRARSGRFALSADEADALIAFDFAVWLADVDFAAAEQQAGRIEISDAENTELLRAFERALGKGVSLYRDRDGDGRLDSDAELLAE